MITLENNQTLTEFVVATLSGAEYSHGALETVDASNENVKRAFGNLLEVLVENKTISLEDVPNIIESFKPIKENR